MALKAWLKEDWEDYYKWLDKRDKFEKNPDKREYQVKYRKKPDSYNVMPYQKIKKEIILGINISNCYETLEKKMSEISDVLEPLQNENYDVRVALANARLMYVTAINILDAYKALKEE